MKKNILLIIGVILIIILNAFAFAQKKSDEKNAFNTNSASQTFDQIQKKLSVHHDYTSMVFYTQKIQDLQNNAKKCVSDSENHLKIIDGLLKTSQADVAKQLHRADLKYLQDKQLYYTEKLSGCRLLVYRSNEALTNYREEIRALSADQILKRNTPIWQLHEDHWVATIENVQFDTMLKISGINSITQNQLISGLILLLFTAVIAFYLRQLLRQAVSMLNHSHPLWESLLCVLSSFVFPCAILGVISIFCNLLFQEMMPTPTLELVSHAALIMVLIMALVKYLFYPSANYSGLFAMLPEHGCIFYRRCIFLLSLLFIGYVVMVTMREQPFSHDIIELTRTLFLTVMSAITIWVFLLWFRSTNANRFHHGTLMFFSTIFISALVLLVLTEWLGYHRLAVFAMTGLCLSMVYTVIVIALCRLIDALYQWVEDNQHASSRKVHHWFGVKPNKKMHEMALIKFAAYVTVLCLYFVAMLKSWSISPIFVDSVVDGLLFGFKVIGLTIVPSRLILACLVFPAIFLMGRLLATSLAGKQQFKDEEYTQIAISTITIYISFAVAFIFAMLVTGVDFTGLAIIAGALSVGVGLGLQNIVNNFVSGLILLLEKPIRPGDRIVIGKTEGFVKKIRIRSTQIATLSKEDVIVPNADFMTQQVTNYMFRDRNSRVSCQVGVAYGSDVHLVKKTLLEIASGHPEVFQEFPNAPVALFSRFGDSSLVFDLWCVIHDVNKKYIVVSDLNFAIDAAFRKLNISIAFPQRDVHIKGNLTVKHPE